MPSNHILEILPVRGNIPRLLLKTALFLVSGLILISASYAMAGIVLHILLLLASIGCLGLFVLNLWRIGYNLRFKGSILTLSPEGIRVALGRHGSSFVSWHQTCGFSLKRSGKQELLLIHLLNPEHVIKEVRQPLERMVLRIHLHATGTPFAIPTSVLTYPGEDLTQLLHTWHTRYYTQASADSDSTEDTSATLSDSPLT